MISIADNKPIYPVRLPFGPSPWFWTGRFFVVPPTIYRFEALDEGGRLAGVTRIANERDEALLLLDFGCYARFLSNGNCLLWWESFSDYARILEFRLFSVQNLQKISNPAVEAKKMREAKQGIGGLPRYIPFSFSCFLESGTYSLNSPDEFSAFEETLTLASHQLGQNGFDKMSRSIFCFDWIGKKVQVIPQDWFNNGDYDFGYQWITRVARLDDGRIIGDGIRLRSFELDESGRQVKRWGQLDSQLPK